MGTIYNIQRFSIHDGPGIRTTVFFKGCNLHCVWCHNPESISFQREVEFYPERCIGCGRCFQVCPKHAHFTDEAGVHRIDRELCDGCLACAESCFAEALVGVGKAVTADEVMKAILTDVPYYESSGGGVTFSGGECMAQVELLQELLTACKKNNIHTAVDTAGNVPWASFQKILDSTDLFLYDLKAADSALHAELTGSGNEQIVDNLKRLCEAGKRIFVRIPYIPGVNSTEIAAMARILEGLAVEQVEVLPYHRLGEGKYASLGIPGSVRHIAIPTEQEIQAAVDTLRACGLNAFKA
jgi:glycyl-radical enzyme activating protein